MVRRNLSELATYQISENIEVLPIECLKDLYLDKTSEIIYILKHNTLYGIVCIEDLFKTESRIVSVNKNFTRLLEFDIIKAHEIFNRRRNIHKIPIVNNQGELMSDYSRWDDVLYIERIQDRLAHVQLVKEKVELTDIVYVIEPVISKFSIYKCLLENLDSNQIKYVILKKEHIISHVTENALFIFVDEDEKRGNECLLKIMCNEYFDLKFIEDGRIKFITYKELLSEMTQETQFEKYGLSNYSYNNIDEKATFLLSRIENRGVKCFCIYLNEDKQTQYGNAFKESILNRIKNDPINDQVKAKEDNKREFYGELYQNKDYETDIAQQEIAKGVFSFEYQKNISGKYFNSKSGVRLTYYQPEEYIGTVYLLGPCTIIGGYVEDQYTIASYLQRCLLQKGYEYKVENYGAMIRVDSEIDIRLQGISKFCENDIVIYLSRVGKAQGIQGDSLEKIFEKSQIPCEWVIDGYMHCNHKVNKIISDSLMKMIEPYLGCKTAKYLVNDICNDVKDYVFEKYIEKNSYLCNISVGANNIGSIVMNCNPFTKGHRFLIEESSKNVDWLIVFVVEEDVSLFTFEERYWMVKNGTQDLANVIVVPGGEFILSGNNFSEYFTKKDNEVAILNAEYDISIFADYIAKPFHISYRFAGEEPNDRLTSIYNKAMRKILPQKGIEFVEFPRITIDKEVVSASAVRRYLQECEYKKAFVLVPETTKRYLERQCSVRE